MDPEPMYKLKDTSIFENAISQHDPVNNPSHYRRGKIDCADFILDQGMNFCKGNAVKYITRAGHKDKNKEVEDLQKAIWYLNREIKRLTNA